MTQPPLLECTRNATGPERRHIRIQGQEAPLCATPERQNGAGASTYTSILLWSNCKRCKAAALRIDPHPRQI